jgi:hypothetical protein
MAAGFPAQEADGSAFKMIVARSAGVHAGIYREIAAETVALPGIVFL